MITKTGLLSAFSLFLSLALAPSPASAQSFSPTNTTTTLSGVLLLQGDISILCDVRIDVSIDGNGQATVTGRSFSSASPGTSLFCGGLVRPVGTWSLAPDSTTRVTATVGIAGFATSCSGAVTATWNNANSSLTFFNALVPGAPAPCLINGTLTANPAITIVP